MDSGGLQEQRAIPDQLRSLLETVRGVETSQDFVSLVTRCRAQGVEEAVENVVLLGQQLVLPP